MMWKEPRDDDRRANLWAEILITTGWILVALGSGILVGWLLR